MGTEVVGQIESLLNRLERKGIFLTTHGNASSATSMVKLIEYHKMKNDQSRVLPDVVTQISAYIHAEFARVTDYAEGMPVEMARHYLKSRLAEDHVPIDSAALGPGEVAVAFLLKKIPVRFNAMYPNGLVLARHRFT